MPKREPLQVESFAISAGSESIGLPSARSRETLLDRYLALLARLRPSNFCEPTFRDADIARLSEATGLDEGAVRIRLTTMITEFRRTT